MCALTGHERVSVYCLVYKYFYKIYACIVIYLPSIPISRFSGCHCSHYKSDVLGFHLCYNSSLLVSITILHPICRIDDHGDVDRDVYDVMLIMMMLMMRIIMYKLMVMVLMRTLKTSIPGCKSCISIIF